MSIKVKWLISLWAILCISPLGVAQSNLQQEQVTVNTNRDMLFVGEVLRYALYCKVPVQNTASALSQYAYAELIGEDNTVFRHKLFLENGQGHHEFFLPTTLPTGKYYLVVNTRWMKNFDDYETIPLTIINPFEGYDQKDFKVEKEMEGDLNAYAKAGDLVNGKKSNLIVEYTSAEGYGVSTDLILFDRSGQFQQPFTTNNAGYASIEFTPQANFDYSIATKSQINTDKTFDLKVQNSGQALFVEQQPDRILLFVQPDERTKQARLSMFLNDRRVETWEINGTELISIDRASLSQEVYRFSLRSNSRRLTQDFYIANLTNRTETLYEDFAVRNFTSISVEVPAGDYSVSVRDVFSASPDSKEIAGQPDNLFEEWKYKKRRNEVESPRTKEEVVYLPEFNGELLSGTVKSENGANVFDKTVMLSFSADNDLISAAQTDAKGAFSMMYRGPWQEQSKALFSVYDFENDYQIELETNFIDSVKPLDFGPPFIDSTYIEAIIAKSVAVQLENTYFEFINTNIKSKEPIGILNEGDYNYTYKLDDYTRFKTLREHFVEYISVATMPKGQKIPFSIRTPYPEIDYGRNPPLILLDGMVMNDRAIVEINPYRIEAVDIINSRFFLNAIAFDGVVNFRSFDRQFNLLDENNDQEVVMLETPVKPKSISVLANYRSLENQRRPDMRTELLWVPLLNAEEQKVLPIDFYTSDVTGLFEIVVSGYTKNGSPLEIKKLFKVQENEE